MSKKPQTWEYFELPEFYCTIKFFFFFIVIERDNKRFKGCEY